MSDHEKAFQFPPAGHSGSWRSHANKILNPPTDDEIKQIVAAAQQDHLLHPGDIAAADADARVAYSILEYRLARREALRTGQKFLINHVIDRNEAIKYYGMGWFPHRLMFEVPGGSDGYEAVIADGSEDNPYYLGRSNVKIVEANSEKIRADNQRRDSESPNGRRRHVVFGAGGGHVEAMLLRGCDVHRLDIKNIDLSRESWLSFQASMEAEGVPAERIQYFDRDFMKFGPEGMWGKDDKFWFENIRAPDDPTPLSIQVINVLTNSPLNEVKQFLKKLSGVMRKGDVATISFDSEYDYTLLGQAYGAGIHDQRRPNKKRLLPPPFKPWFSSGFHYLSHDIIGLQNIVPKKLTYSVRTPTEKFKVINVQGLIGYGRKHPRPVIPPELDRYLNELDPNIAQPFRERVANYRDEPHIVLDSRRFMASLLRDTYKEFGLMAIDQLGQKDPPGPPRPGGKNYIWQVVLAA